MKIILWFALILLGIWILSGCENSTEVQDKHASGSDCYSCHENKFYATTRPNHVTAGFSIYCEDCHNTKSWIGNIVHDFFPLDGVHANLACTDCHTNGTYLGLSPECISCHPNN